MGGGRERGGVGVGEGVRGGVVESLEGISELVESPTERPE